MLTSKGQIPGNNPVEKITGLIDDRATSKKATTSFTTMVENIPSEMKVSRD
ncbi:MAG: hypothetical protein AAF587_44935 [Bacteroidota bacterium]